MFLQKKEYIRLFRGNEKLMTAGLCKLVIWDQKIKVDYYMDHLPLANGTEGSCHLLYLVSKEGEQNLIQRETVFSLVFQKSKFHYAFQTRENKDYKIVKIEDCYIELEGNHTILMHASPMQMKQQRSADSDMAGNPQGSIAAEASGNVRENNAAEASENVPGNNAAQASENESGNALENSAAQASENESGDAPENNAAQALGNTPENSAAEMQGNILQGMAAEAPEDMPESNAADMTGVMAGDAAADIAESAPENRSENVDTDAAKNAVPYPVRRIDDLKELLTMGDSFVELYYNSFLLHSFYQYRHFLLGKDFLGVPGYFYEREAIAAKMMGFPYFIEAEHADNCCLEEEKRTDKPIEGSYGYFIRSVGA